ncbi:hypothetical protein [Stenotrophomonas sp. G4]|uniref:hypothetical protein n=1 Tax=Stenotrophomonas sp. G4 TaxID=2303750 RepID=UPI0013C2C976|nr:hypothetical protein [Stenotrophomonas sp. G4]
MYLVAGARPALSVLGGLARCQRLCGIGRLGVQGGRMVAMSVAWAPDFLTAESAASDDDFIKASGGMEKVNEYDFGWLYGRWRRREAQGLFQVGVLYFLRIMDGNYFDEY